MSSYLASILDGHPRLHCGTNFWDVNPPHAVSPGATADYGYVEQTARLASLSVWRLDTIVGMLYHGLPMSSTDTNIMVHTCKQELCVRPQHIRFRASSVALVIVLKALAQSGYTVIPPQATIGPCGTVVQGSLPTVLFGSNLLDLRETKWHTKMRSGRMTFYRACSPMSLAIYFAPQEQPVLITVAERESASLELLRIEFGSDYRLPCQSKPKSGVPAPDESVDVFGPFSIEELQQYRRGGECFCGRLYLVPNTHLWLLVAELFPTATPWATNTPVLCVPPHMLAAACRSQNTRSLNSNKQQYPRSHLPRRTLRAAEVSPLTIATWNVLFLLDNPRSNRSKRRTVLVARDLARYKLDIAALSKTRFSEQGQLEKVGVAGQRQRNVTQVSLLPSGTTSWDVCPVCRRASMIA
ncbi:unnamed protein product [Schistocephalus solidus]|uniref:Endonuclease/exonuclease/phosphatase n=1 Tax=Schistocephalus solidus TaxID=70667 RepID=A0A183SNC9_SCHSO|nr:unnamed protein product [Schistocephalus solidus]